MGDFREIVYDAFYKLFAGLFLRLLGLIRMAKPCGLPAPKIFKADILAK